MAAPRLVPGSALVGVLAGAAALTLAALATGASSAVINRAAIAGGAVVLLAAAFDVWRSVRAWRAAPPELTRQLPAALAIGVKREIPITLASTGPSSWHCLLHDDADAALATTGLPVRLPVEPGRASETTYTAIPTRRGDARFAPADVRVRSRWGLFEFQERIGIEEVRRVYPDFAQVARYAWLAGDRRLQQIGIKSYRRRGEGTEFRQLREYRVGDSVRQIDWRATLRHDKPIVREYQDERDQCVMLLVDCGRRMRADDRAGAVGTTHFDQVLNAVLLMAYVALRQGDAVGACTFGTPPSGQRAIAPQKGVHALAGLMGALYDVQPTTAHPDYAAAARDVLKRQRRRALVIMITNFRDEDGSELRQALRVLRSRHLVLLATLREAVIDELRSQPLNTPDAILDTAGAHWYEQSRRDAFHKLAAGDGLMVDAPPDQLGVELVNRYHALKGAGRI